MRSQRRRPLLFKNPEQKDLLNKLWTPLLSKNNEKLLKRISRRYRRRWKQKQSQYRRNKRRKDEFEDSMPYQSCFIGMMRKNYPCLI
jgi:hypothetical protein